MDIERFSQLLIPWLAAKTWHTGHPEDEQRFHQALKSAFDEFGTPITSDELRKAISLGLNYHLVDAKLFAGTIETFAQRANDIACNLINQSPIDALIVSGAHWPPFPPGSTKYPCRGRHHRAPAK